MKVKRSLALLLTLLMLCSLMPNAFAGNLLPGNVYPTDSGSGGGHTHDWGPFRVTREPTCSEYGQQVRTCRTCGERDVQGIPKLPHTFGEWEILIPATDHSAGERQHTCEICGEVEKESYDPKGTFRPGMHGDAVQWIQEHLVDHGHLDHHYVTRDYDWTTEQAVKAFQTAQGFTPDGIAWPQTVECLEHDFDAWVVTKEMTWYETGERQRTCLKCGFTETEVIGTILRPADWRNDRDKVIALQEMLNKLGYSVGMPDGDYGGKTQAAVEQLQKDHGLDPDGILWPGLWNLIFPPDFNYVGELWDPENPDGLQEEGSDGTLFPRPNNNPVLNVPIVPIHEADRDADEDGTGSEIPDPGDRGTVISRDRDDPDDDIQEPEDEPDDPDEPDEPDEPENPEDNPDSADLPAAAGKGGISLDVELKIEILTPPEADGTYKEDSDVEFRYVLCNHTPYTIKDVKVVPLSQYQWDTMQINKDYLVTIFDAEWWESLGLQLEEVDYNKFVVAEEEEVGPFETVTWPAINLFHYQATTVNGGNGTYYLKAFANCDFYEEEEYLGRRLPMAEATVKFGKKPAPELSAELYYKITSEPANGQFYTDGDTVSYNIYLHNSSNYDIKKTKGYRLNKTNVEHINGGGGLGSYFEQNETLKPGQTLKWGPYTGKLSFFEESGWVKLQYTDEKPHDWSGLNDDHIDLAAFANCQFYENDKKIGEKPVTAADAIPIGQEVPAAKLEIVNALKPDNGTYYVEGETVMAEFFLDNKGNVTISSGKLFDTTDGWDHQVANATIDPGNSYTTYFYEGTVSAEEAEKGEKLISGFADCTFKLAAGEASDHVEDTLSLPTGPKPEATLTVEEADPPANTLFYEEGEEIRYKVIIHNTGKVALVSTELMGGIDGASKLIGTQTNLPAGTDSVPFFIEHTVTHEEAQTGTLTCAVTADAVFELGMELPLSGDCTSKTGAPAIMINIAEASSASDGFYKRNETVSYVITLSNTGNVDIPQVDVYFTTPLGTAALDQIFDFSTTSTYTESYIVDGPDVAAGELTVTATAQGTFKGEPELETSASYTVNTGMLPVNVKVVIAEFSSPGPYGYYTPSEVVDYMVTVTNAGEETLPMAVVKSYLPGIVTDLDTVTAFPPNTYFDYPVHYTVTDTDAGNGKVAHLAESVFTLPDDSMLTADYTLEVDAGFPPVPGEDGTEPDGDSCIRTEIGEEDGKPIYLITPCEEHKKVENTVEAWTKALKQEYEDLARIANAGGKIAITEEEDAFFAWLEAQELPEDECIALLKDHCADLCYLSHTAKTDTAAELLLEAAQFIPGYDPAAQE